MERSKKVNLKLVYIELAELRDALQERRHKKFCELTRRSSKSPEELMEIQRRWYPEDLRLGESNVEDRYSRITGIEGSMVICTSILNKIAGLEKGLQELLQERTDRRIEAPEPT